MKRNLVILVFMLLVQQTLAQTCKDTILATTPIGRFTLNGDEVRDNSTGLIWQRCAVGQTGSDCSEGSASRHTWQQALQKGNGSWRLPNVNELHSIIEERCYGPALNESVFPGTNFNWDYWSSSTFVLFSDKAWVVDVYKGFSWGYHRKTEEHFVRLVRSGSLMPNPLFIGDIQDASNAGGCYCSFHPFLADGKIIRERYLFISDAAGKAWMNINGQDVEFIVTEQCNAGSQAGLYFGSLIDQQCGEHATYIGAGMNVQVDLVETWHCPPENEECEITDFDALITVKKGDFQQSVKAKGTCGC